MLLSTSATAIAPRPCSPIKKQLHIEVPWEQDCSLEPILIPRDEGCFAASAARIVFK